MVEFLFTEVYASLARARAHNVSGVVGTARSEHWRSQKKSAKRSLGPVFAETLRVNRDFIWTPVQSSASAD